MIEGVDDLLLRDRVRDHSLRERAILLHDRDQLAINDQRFGRRGVAQLPQLRVVDLLHDGLMCVRVPSDADNREREQDSNKAEREAKFLRAGERAR